MKYLLLLLTLTVSLSGCALFQSRDGRGIEPESVANIGTVVSIFRFDPMVGLRKGTGVIFGNGCIVTVEHVAPSTKAVYTVENMPAEIVGSVKYPNAYESLVHLHVSGVEWPEEYYFEAFPHHNLPPYWTVTERGKVPFTPSTITYGDSGSAVLSRKGYVIGHVSQVLYHETPRQRTVFSRYPTGFSFCPQNVDN